MDRIRQGYNRQIRIDGDLLPALPVYLADVLTTSPGQGRCQSDSGCAKCHDEGGSLPGDDAGILAAGGCPGCGISMADYKAGHREMTKKMKKAVESSAIPSLRLFHFASQR